MLETLAENRDLQPNIEEAEKMLTQVDVTRFASCRWGMRDGIEKGELEKAQAIARNLLQLGGLPDTEIANVTGLSLEQVQQLKVSH